MSSASQTVAERRLRPIYDWLDNGNNKKALQEAEKVLKKQPDFLCCRALMSLALLRMGREDEALSVLTRVLEVGPTEDATLQAMAIAYRELQQPEQICLAYEKASKKQPGNEELLSQLFISYVRLGYYKKQQVTAQQLYKVRPKNPYFFWAVMSILLQADDSDERMARGVLLPLAQRMVAKMHQDGKMEQEQETHLYLMVLEQQHKFQEAMDILNSPLGQRLNEQTSYLHLVDNKKMEYMKKLEMWPQLNVLAKEMLRKCPDQWNVYLDYIGSVFSVLSARDAATDASKDYPDDVDATIGEARRFVRYQQEQNAKCRGPFLAEMELQCRAQARRDKEAEDVSLEDLLVNYFEKFGSKPCCFSDLKLFLPSLVSSKHESFFARTKDNVQFDDQSKEMTVATITRHACWHEMRRFCGLHHTLSAPQAMTLVTQLESAHERSQSVVKTYAATEQRPSDFFLVLAGHLLWQLWTREKEDKYFWKAVVLLEYGIKLSPASYHIRFLLVRLYNQVGAVGSSHLSYVGLDLKHIQLDSLGHLIARHTLTCAHFSEASNVFGNTLKFFTGTYKDTVDHIISAYRCGSFDKIREFIKMRDRLSSSQHYTSLTVERMLLDLFFEPELHAQTVQMMSYLDVDPDKDEINWKDLRDNRDLTAMVSYDSADRSVSDELISESFILEQKFLRFRSLTMRSLAAAVYLSEDIHPARRRRQQQQQQQQNGSKDNNGGKPYPMLDVIQQLADSLQQALAECREQEQEQQDFLNPLQGPSRPRLLLYLRDGHVDFLVALLRLVVQVHKLGPEEAAGDAAAADPAGMAAKIGEQFAGMVRAQVERMQSEDSRSMMKREENMEAIFNLAESSGFACVLCGVCLTLLRPVTRAGNARKSKKKKEIHPVLVNFISSYNTMVESLDSSLKTLTKCLDDWKKVLQQDKLAAVEHKFSTLFCGSDEAEADSAAKTDEVYGFALDAVQEEVIGHMAKSYDTSLVNLWSAIRKKINYLGFLKL